jgi:hypothetical protein
MVRLPRAVKVPLELYAEDGITLIGRSESARFEPGKAYTIHVE